MSRAHGDGDVILGLDVGAMGSALALPLVYWGVAVFAITSFGYPGVVCCTPVAWLLALFVGRDVVLRSKSPAPRLRLVEAGMAGGLLGLAYGLLLAVVGLLRIVEQPEDVGATIVLSVGMGVGGTIACAILAVAFGALYERKRDSTRDW